MLKIQFIALCIFYQLYGIAAQSALQLTSTHEQILIEKHNVIREDQGSSDMRILTWDENMATTARTYATQCEYPEYSTTVNGENMFASTTSSVDANINAVTGIWNDEVSNYDYNSRTCSATCRNYLQIVWASTSKFGCGAAICPGKAGLLGGSAFTLIVCHYSEKGNVTESVQPYAKGTPCSECTTPDDYCYANLCANVDRDNTDFRTSSGADTTTTSEITTSVPSATTVPNTISNAVTPTEAKTTTTPTTPRSTTTKDITTITTSSTEATTDGIKTTDANNESTTTTTTSTSTSAGKSTTTSSLITPRSTTVAFSTGTSTKKEIDTTTATPFTASSEAISNSNQSTTHTTDNPIITHLSTHSSTFPETSSSSSLTISTTATQAISASFTSSSNPCGGVGYSNGRRFLFDTTLCVQFYYECVHNEVIQRPCAAGTKFDVKSTTCTWPRDIAACQVTTTDPTTTTSTTISNTLSSSTTNTQTSSPSTTPASNPCGGVDYPNGRRFLYDTALCVQFYYECVHNEVIHRPCAAGTKFDVKSTLCTWPRNIAACQVATPSSTKNVQYTTGAATETPITTNTSPASNPCGGVGYANGRRFLYDTALCVQFYYECVHNEVIQRPCAAGTKFDVKSTTCTWPRDVAACQGTTTDSTTTTSTTISNTLPSSTTKTQTSSPTTPSSTTNAEYTTVTATGTPITSTTSPDSSTCTPTQRKFATMMRDWEEAMDDWYALMNDYNPCP